MLFPQISKKVLPYPNNLNILYNTYLSLSSESLTHILFQLESAKTLCLVYKINNLTLFSMEQSANFQPAL
jgi:hypothetical protein